MDLIERQAAIEAVSKGCQEWRGIFGMCEENILALPPAQPEHLTDDDFETIRIHLSAFKERLCNQGRWKEAEEYERLINRFMSFASAQPEIIRCRDCKHYYFADNRIPQEQRYVCDIGGEVWQPDDYCSYAERGEVSE